MLGRMPQIAGFRGVLQQDVSKPGAPELGKALAAGTVQRDGSRAVYRYHQVFAVSGGRSFVRRSLICAVRLAPWSERSIRPHEATVPAAREAALAAIRANGAHTQPVLAGFRDGPLEVDRLMRKFEGGKPAIELATPDGTVHQVWRVQDAETLGKSKPEHDEMRRVIAELRRTDPRDRRHDDLVFELMRDVVHHVADEETVLLPEAEQTLSKERLSELGAQMTRRRLELVTPKAGKIATNQLVGFSGSTAALVVGVASALFAARAFTRKPA